MTDSPRRNLSHRWFWPGTHGSMPAQTIVVAEDDSAVRELVMHHLQREGFAPLGAQDGHAALRRAREGADLLVLDIGLPGIDGYDIARRLQHEQRNIPIVILTARSDEIDRVVGFELGVDDYVAKPFSPRELVARVKAILRRSGQVRPSAQTVLRFGRLEIDESAREARVDGVDARLKPREFALLLELASNAGVALTRSRLLERVWGFDFDGDERTIDVHVRRLRAKLQERWRLPPLVQTIHGFGYKFLRA